MSVPRRDITIQKRPKTPSEAELHRQQVQALAAQVVDEAHWRTILESAETDEQRQELERVVGPMLTFRRAAPCATPGCESGEQGLWQPVLVVSSPAAVTEPCYVPIELRLCGPCKADAQLSNFLTDGIWSQVLSAWPEPALPPVRRLTTLSWDRMH